MIRQGRVNGHQAVWLENETFSVGVLPHKGADIFELVYRAATGGAPIQFLMQTPWGLKPPAPQVLDFLDNYEGGWQELFPNANDGCQYRGLGIPFHGEVALEPWNFTSSGAGSDPPALDLSVECHKTPFRLERHMELTPGEGGLLIREKVTNIGPVPHHFVWGHHLTLGGDFLEDGCRLDIPARDVYTPDALYEPLTARLKEGQTSAWPMASSRTDTPVDLSRIPGSGARSHDDVIVGGLERGFYRVVNPRLKLAFSLEWDVAVFPWLMVWQPYGGAELPPLTGIYGIGLEPWLSRYPLAKAVETGQAACLNAGETLSTELMARVGPM